MLFRTCYCIHAEVDFYAVVLIVKAGIIEKSIVLLFTQLVFQGGGNLDMQ